jgi:hypothetical protein
MRQQAVNTRRYVRRFLEQYFYDCLRDGNQVIEDMKRRHLLDFGKRCDRIEWFDLHYRGSSLGIIADQVREWHLLLGHACEYATKCYAFARTCILNDKPLQLVCVCGAIFRLIWDLRSPTDTVLHFCFLARS